ncbi:hypothetical protein [Niabella beijingensis]|uniref:hypothetical protein n=1 Tax=Niabella beijingensis TaxID=2872700 RepID=UPI001CC05048|nr:hypothetical protein [Niabella beijingensis]MBZ4192668.1 hypothetical protein [Niabella beijingensis]
MAKNKNEMNPFLLLLLAPLLFICPSSAENGYARGFYSGDQASGNIKVAEHGNNFQHLPAPEVQKKKVLISGYFEGNEPFWNMEIRDNLFILHCVNDTEKDTLYLSKKEAHSETYAFHSKKAFGIIRKSDGHCKLDITEEEGPTHEIYFSYKNATYRGCGKLKFQTK